MAAKMSATVSVARRDWPPAASNDGRGANVCLMTRSSDELIAAAKRGEPPAQRRLYEEHRSRVYRLMVRMVGADDAADVTQQVFLQVLRKIGQFSGQSQFTTWLYRLAVNEALQHLRRRRRAKSSSLEYDVVDRSPPRVGRCEQAELLEEALARLDSDLRAMFLLREVEGLSYQEIAAAVGIAEGTVGSRLNRARQLLREYLIELGWQP